MNIIFWHKSLKEKLFLWFTDLFDRFSRERVFLLIFLLALLFTILNWLFAFGLYKLAGNQQVILHYSIKFGADKIGSPANIFLMPTLSLVILLANVAIANSLERSKKFTANLLLFVALVFAQITLSGLFSIYLINFR
jgi:hypothetical protein